MDTSIQVTRREADERFLQWELYRRPAARALAAIVPSYDGYVMRAPAPSIQPEFPTGRVVMILGFGDPMTVRHRSSGAVSERVTAFVAGLHDTHVRTESGCRSAGVQLNLTPIGAYMLLGRPMHELANRAVDLLELFGAEGDALMGRIAEADAWSERFELIDEALARRLADAPMPSEAVAWAWQRIERSGGRVNIGPLSAELGWSRKRMVSQFREHVGLAPKQVARIARFRTAAGMLRRGVRPLAAAALAAGYYDQAHFTRDFRDIAGMTPGEFAGDDLHVMPLTEDVSR